VAECRRDASNAVGLCARLCDDAPISLLMDEPFSALDPLIPARILQTSCLELFSAS